MAKSAFREQTVPDALELAVWLRSRTRLTNQQIADFCGLSQEEVLARFRPRPIAHSGSELSADHGRSEWYDEFRRNRVWPRLLDQRELLRCAENAAARMARPFWALDFEAEKFREASRSLAGPIVGSEITSLWHLNAGRSAWHSTWAASFTYGTILPDLDWVQRLAEGDRVSGTTFRIEEIPGLALRSDCATLIVFEVNNGRVLESLMDEGLPEPSLQGVLSWVRAAPTDSVFAIACDDPVCFTPIKRSYEFTDFKSHSRGRGALAWQRVPSSSSTETERSATAAALHGLRQRLQGKVRRQAA